MNMSEYAEKKKLLMRFFRSKEINLRRKNVCVCSSIIYNEEVLHGFRLIMRMKIDFLNVFVYVRICEIFLNSVKEKFLNEKKVK